jgi:hypothetical protein
MSHSTSHHPPLPDIKDAMPLGEEDRACMVEIRDVLRRHGALQRFGLTLLHRHFELAEDEVLVESVDAKNRIIRQLPRKISSVNTGIETSWRLDMFKELQHCETVCQVQCDYDGVAYHIEEHESIDKET